MQWSARYIISRDMTHLLLSCRDNDISGAEGSLGSSSPPLWLLGEDVGWLPYLALPPARLGIHNSLSLTRPDIIRQIKFPFGIIWISNWSRLTIFVCENKTDLVRGDGDGGGDESSRGCDGRGEECPLSSQIVHYSYFPLSHFWACCSVRPAVERFIPGQPVIRRYPCYHGQSAGDTIMTQCRHQTANTTITPSHPYHTITQSPGEQGSQLGVQCWYTSQLIWWWWWPFH